MFDFTVCLFMLYFNHLRVKNRAGVQEGVERLPRSCVCFPEAKKKQKTGYLFVRAFKNKLK